MIASIPGIPHAMQAGSRPVMRAFVFTMISSSLEVSCRYAVQLCQSFQERGNIISWIFLQAESDVPPFHYGSHYSAAGVVLFYLIRLEPFTRLSRNLQVILTSHSMTSLCETPDMIVAQFTHDIHS